jgi:hypothetical protein
MPDHVKSLAVAVPVTAAGPVPGGPLGPFGEGYAVVAVRHKGFRCVSNHGTVSKALVISACFKGFPRCG